MLPVPMFKKLKCFYNYYYNTTPSQTNKRTTTEMTTTSSAYPTVQCQNLECYRWNYNPTPGANCVKCMEPLPVWVGYLNADKYKNEPYVPTQPLERTGYQEMWYDDDEEKAEEKKPHTHSSSSSKADQAPPVTNKERVFQNIMVMYGLDRAGAIKKIDQMVKSVVVDYF